MTVTITQGGQSVTIFQTGVPSGANIVDTRVSVNDTLVSTSTDEALSANQGRALKVLVDGLTDLSEEVSVIRFGTMQELAEAYAENGGSAVYSPVGMVDAGSVSLELTDENLILVGDSYFTTGIFSTADNYTMFKNAAGEFAANLDIRQMSFYTSGTGSKIFDLDGTGNSGAVEFASCNIGDFSGATTEIGTLANFRQFKTNNVGFFRIQDGLTFAGTWAGGFRITETIVLAQAANSTLFKPAAGLTFAGRCISDINAASVDPTTVTFDFVSANFLLDGGFQLTGASFAPNSSISVTMDETDIKAYFRDCVEIKNTHVRCLIEWSSQALNNLVANTEAKILGSTVEIYGTWMAQTANNRIEIETSNVVDVEASFNGRIDAGPTDEIAVSIYQWDDSANAFVQTVRKIKTVSNVQGGLDVVDFDITGLAQSVSKGDFFEARIENLTDGTNATVLNGSELKIVRI